MELSDEVLVRHVVTHSDADAFAVLVRRHQSRILLLQRRLCGEASLAEDLSQETFLRAWQKLDTFKGSGSLSGWLSRLAYNVFLQDVRRQKKHRGQVDFDSLEQPPGTEPEDPRLADLNKLLSILPREEQVMMVLNYACGLSNTEVGEVLGLPTGTVKARIHRAKAKIRTYLEAPSEPVVKSTADVNTNVGTTRNQTSGSTAVKFSAGLTGALRA